MQPTHTILLAEEDDAVRVFLADNLTADGYHVLAAADRQSALEQLARAQPDVVVCDVNGDTLEPLDAVRGADGVASRVDPDVPLIVLTARADELARVRYLDHGSDDVIGKPFSYAELRSRIRALLRRSHARHLGRITRVGTLRTHHAARQVSVGDTPVAVSGKEYALLAYLATDPARVFTRDELLRDIWGFRLPARTRTLDSHACRLRKQARRRRRAPARAGDLGRGVPTRLARRAPVPGRGVKRAPLRRATPLRPGAPPERSSPLARRTPLRGGVSSRSADGDARRPLAASEAQREKISGRWCVVCQQTRGITPAHLAPRALGGCDDPECVVPLCWMHHRAYDTGRRELLPYLEPRWRAEIAHGVLHLGLIGAVRRLAPRRD